MHNINYLNYTKTQTNRNKKTGLNTTNNGTKKRTRANIQKEHIIKTIKQKSKNTFDSTSNKVSNNYSKYISNHILNLKNELIQICDMINNKDKYTKLGAKLPAGVLLYGEPGLGKTLMAKCFIDECKLEAFTIRKNKSENFVEYIAETFKKAKEKAPAIIFLDDMDKFANEDELKLLKVTPATYLGSCRRKLKDEFKEIFDVFEKYDIGYFFYMSE